MSTPGIDQVKADLAQARARLIAAEARLVAAEEKGDKELILMYGNQVTMWGNRLTELEKAETAKVADASFSAHPSEQRAEMKETVKLALAEHEIEKFFRSKCGIADLSSVSEKSVIQKDEVRKLFDHKCLITGTPYIAPAVRPGDTYIPTHKVAHIVQRKMRHSQGLCNRFQMHPTDLDKEPNLLLIESRFEKMMDTLQFCFIPSGDHTFALRFAEGVAVPTGCPREVVMPLHVSRKSLMIQAMDFHRHHQLHFDFDPWKQDDPRNSIGKFIHEWYAGLPAQPAPLD